MTTPTPHQKIEIVRRVHRTFDLPIRWHRHGWGRDDNDDPIGFDCGVPVVDSPDKATHALPELRPPAHDSPRCFCLAGAIRIHTGNVLPLHPSDTEHAADEICAVYTHLAGIPVRHPEPGPYVTQPHLNALVEWNDADERRFEDIRALTAAAQQHLDPEP